MSLQTLHRPPDCPRWPPRACQHAAARQTRNRRPHLLSLLHDRSNRPSAPPPSLHPLPLPALCEWSSSTRSDHNLQGQAGLNYRRPRATAPRGRGRRREPSHVCPSEQELQRLWPSGPRSGLDPARRCPSSRKPRAGAPRPTPPRPASTAQRRHLACNLRRSTPPPRHLPATRSAHLLLADNAIGARPTRPRSLATGRGRRRRRRRRSEKHA
jgi:hypothetical protein